MRALCPVLFACAMGLWSGVCGASPLTACESETAMTGIRERLATLDDQMNRIEWTTDRAERRALMDLHMKHMHESLRELRKRDLGSACRMDLMSAMLEEMVRHQQAMSEPEAR
ncbi:MAG: hypothetical protein ACXWAC_14160 [Usitatibacter sp.]